MLPATWVKPELVCEVGLSGWTEDGVMRQPVFLRLREDKAAREVVRETRVRRIFYHGVATKTQEEINQILSI